MRGAGQERCTGRSRGWGTLAPAEARRGLTFQVLVRNGPAELRYAATEESVEHVEGVLLHAAQRRAPRSRRLWAASLMSFFWWVVAQMNLKPEVWCHVPCRIWGNARAPSSERVAETRIADTRYVTNASSRRGERGEGSPPFHRGRAIAKSVTFFGGGVLDMILQALWLTVSRLSVNRCVPI